MSKQKKVSKGEILSLDITKFVMLRDNLLVRALRPKDKNGLVDPAQYEDKPEFGEVISYGEKVTSIQLGAIVRFGKYSTEMIRSNGEDYFIVREEDISGYMPR